MPTYTAKCPRCGHVQEYRQPIRNRDDTPLCVECGKITERQLDAPAGHVDTPAAK